MKCFLSLLLLLVVAFSVNAQPIVETIPLTAPDQPVAIQSATPSAPAYSVAQPTSSTQTFGTTPSEPAAARAPDGPPVDVGPLLEKLNRLFAETNPDPGRVALAFSTHLIKSLTEEKLLGLLDNMAKEMKGRVDLAEHPEDRAFLLGLLATDQFGIISIPNPVLDLPPLAGEETKRYPNQMFFIHDVIMRGTANHIGLSSLYMALAHRLGMNVRPVIMPEHMYLVYEDDGQTFYLEPTNEGQITDIGFYHQAASTRARAHHRPLNLREYAGLMLTYMAGYYQGAKQDSASLACAQAAVEWFPEGDAGWVVLAMSLQDVERDDEAITCYDRALDLNPDEFIAVHNRAFALLNAERYADAERDLRAVMQEKPDYMLAKVGLIKSLEGQGKEEEALQIDRDIAKKTPGSNDKIYRKGVATFQAGKAAAAIEIMREFIIRQPADPRGHHALGNMLCATKQIEEGLASYDKAIELDPSSANSWLAKAQTYVLLGDAAKAMDAADGLVAAKPDDPESYHVRGSILLASKRLPEAIEQFDKATDLDPAFTDSWLAKIEAHMVLRNVTEAEEAARGLIGAAPSNPEGYNTLGKILLTGKKVAEAIDQFDKAIEVDPDFLPAWMAKAQTYLLVGDLPKAEEAVNEVLRFAPDTPELNPMRAAIHLEKKEFKEAVPFLENHLRAAPPGRRLELRRELLMIYLTKAEARNPVRAVELAEAINRITEEKSAPDLVILASAYHANNQPEEADKAFQKAEDLARNDEEKLFLLREYRKLREVTQ